MATLLLLDPDPDHLVVLHAPFDVKLGDPRRAAPLYGWSGWRDATETESLARLENANSLTRRGLLFRVQP